MVSMQTRASKSPFPVVLLVGRHPMHLHGHTFWVVRGAGNSSYNFVDPIVRDVVSIGNTGDNVTIRFFTDNPGPWFLHCHIDWHLANGFAVVFAEDVPDTQSAYTVTDAWKNLCPLTTRGPTLRRPNPLFL
ncbi:multicopper oxidase-domain-containing protein [Lactarius hengduanensis]|nr:multicopper oxidase-domain-containing protein [Lactarius hengduanensis]